MSAVLAPSLAVDRPARLPVEPRVEDRWSFARQADKRPASILAIVLCSVAVHAVFVGAMVLTGGPSVPPPPHEIAVEIVQEAPKPAPPPPPIKAKSEPLKSEPPKSEPPKSEPPKSEPAKSEPAKSEPAKSEPPKSEPAKSEPAKLESPKPPTVQQEQPKPAAEDARQAEALRQELASLKAEHAALEQSATAPAPPPTGSGALTNAFQAIALPGAGDGSGEAVTYREMIFSQLAKAKDIGQVQGHAGTAGVRFEIDAAGALVGVDVVSPSGIAALDAEALAIVRRAAPFPPPPKGSERQFFANVNFVPQAAP